MFRNVAHKKSYRAFTTQMYGVASAFTASSTSLFNAGLLVLPPSSLKGAERLITWVQKTTTTATTTTPVGVVVPLPLSFGHSAGTIGHRPVPPGSPRVPIPFALDRLLNLGHLIPGAHSYAVFSLCIDFHRLATDHIPSRLRSFSPTPEASAPASAFAVFAVDTEHRREPAGGDGWVDWRCPGLGATSVLVATHIPFSAPSSVALRPLALESALAVPDTERTPLQNVSNNNQAGPSSAATDLRDLMVQRTAKKIQPAAKDTTHNAATVFEAVRKSYVHMVANCPAALEDLVGRWKLEWDSRCSESLTTEFIVPRFYKNFNREPDSTLGTLGEFYDVHNAAQRTKFFALPSSMKLQPPYIFLEARILVDEFEAKKGCTPPAFSKKLQGALASALPPLKSQFRPLGVYTDVVIAVATMTVDDDGQVDTKFPDLDDENLVTEKCEISKDIIAKGTSQCVYKAVYQNEPRALKRFFNVGNGRNCVTPLENQCELHKEAGRLLQIGWFLNSDVGEDLSITDCTLVIEITKPGQCCIWLLGVGS
ncbi:hypothetical protein GGX14DRAFT_573737 [Mycena pura]|uniref:Uncharacterized protein n=1 Tax=Mycena pura TaxID=153505 RepID=A0AAD6V2N1_9AGAR|nr:hypothetical protein GGX14DRAFT_573737 [Mycena pura]